MRPVCKACNKNPAAANYWRNGVRHYRSRCESCIKRNRFEKIPEPRWRLSGYAKKTQCDLCGFRAKYASQMTVWHIDGDLNNCQLINLRTVCLNCIEVVKRRNTTWRVGEIEVDS